MLFSFSVTGTPADVKQKLMAATKEAGLKDQSTWPALATLRDYVAAQFAGAPDDARVTVSMSVNVSAAITEAKKEKASKS